MNLDEARTLLRSHLETWRRRSYADFVGLLGEPQVAQVRGASGVEYQVEVEVCWDGSPGGLVRVVGSIDDGGWRAFRPLTDGFLVAPDGTFVDE